MNNSMNETKPAKPAAADALLDELDDVILRMGRIMSARHGGQDACDGALTMPQAMLLRMIESHGAAKMSEVAALLAVKPPAASAAVDSLEREGYVSRTIDSADRRVTLVTLTPEGLEALHTAEAHRRDIMRTYLAVLSEDEIRSLITVHNKLIEAMTSNQI
jgi:MarR family transcriptional regulator, organic hydroperoxide resistance regulator